jgi:hypothetical protein
LALSCDALLDETASEVRIDQTSICSLDRFTQALIGNECVPAWQNARTSEFEDTHSLV